MSSSRVVLISSPFSLESRDLERDRTSQTVDAIRRALGAWWIGWPEAPSEGSQVLAEQPHSAKLPARWLELTTDERAVLRDDVNGRMLWPVFYGRADLMHFDASAYTMYEDTNQRLADGLVPTLSSDDLVWVHDYMHAPIASALRRKGMSCGLGFLCHAPFPAPEQLATLPRCDELLRDLCAYDLVAFQSATCRANFKAAALRFLGALSTNGGLHGPFGEIETSVFEIPGQFREKARFAESQEVLETVDHVREFTGNRALIASLATLDPTQGIAERLASFEALLDQDEERRGQVTMVQVAAPRRHWLQEDAGVRADVERSYTHINGRFVTIDWTPIRYFHDLLAPVRLAALYRCAAVGLVTPFSEGVSLVAKDFVASQNGEDPGVLILSNLVAPAERLSGALLVNPYDTAATTLAMREALDMSLEERRERWTSMRNVLATEDVAAWSRAFVDQLAQARTVKCGNAAA